ncbi:unnamed protein product, partial [Mesorhabditis belari]|uniref:non-specific serine/threonine protein kinase n=1 Tax=Mesorhabditis belari TaxID=2138241 RepID=A0AAF3FPS2_9BILA
MHSYETVHGGTLGGSMLMGRVLTHHHPIPLQTHQHQTFQNGRNVHSFPIHLSQSHPPLSIVSPPDMSRPPPAPWHGQSQAPPSGQILMFQQPSSMSSMIPGTHLSHPPPHQQFFTSPPPPPPVLPIQAALHPPQLSHHCLSPQAAPIPPQSKGYFVQSASGGQTMYLSPLPSPVSFPNGAAMISQMYSPPSLPQHIYQSQCVHPQQIFQQPDSMMFVQTPQRQNVLIGPDGQPLTPSSNLDSWNNAVMDMDRSNAIRAKIGLVINNRFQVIQKINFGSYGTIYSAKDLKNENKLVAVKFETSNEDAHLKYEFDVYKVLSGGPRKKRRKPNGIHGVPKVFWFGEDYGQRMMVMSLLGPSLENLFTYCDRTFCRQTILKLGEEMISRLQWLHERGFVHRDLKPENFLIGIEEDERILFLIDFGLARRYRYRDGENLVHIPHRKGKNLVGTAKYASLNSHLGIELSRRDDIESFAYIMAELCCGELPWKESKNKGRYRTKQQSYNRIRNIKESVDWKSACPPLAELFTYAKSMAFTEDPDYVKIRSIVHAIPTWEGGEDHQETPPRKIDSKSPGGSVESSPEKNDDITLLTEQAGAIRLTKSDPTPNNPMVWNSNERLKRNPGRLFRPCSWIKDEHWEYNWIVRRESSDEEKARYQALFRWAQPQHLGQTTLNLR